MGFHRTILMADDDADDRELTSEGLKASNVCGELQFVTDGEQLLDYLHHRGEYAGEHAPARPGLILLDLNMPRMNGREALSAIKSDPALRQIPIVVLTTSGESEDVFRAYDLGANSFITKPSSFDALVEALRAVGRYWFDVVELPGTSTEAIS